MYQSLRFERLRKLECVNECVNERVSDLRQRASIYTSTCRSYIDFYFVEDLSLCMNALKNTYRRVRRQRRTSASSFHNHLFLPYYICIILRV